MAATRTLTDHDLLTMQRRGERIVEACNVGTSEGVEKAWETRHQGTGEQFSHPMKFGQFKAAGNKDADWEKYAAEQNAASRARHQADFKSKWDAGHAHTGNDIVNHLRSKGVAVPSHLLKAMQHDDTRISKTSVDGRGMGRKEASEIHKFASLAMAQ